MKIVFENVNLNINDDVEYDIDISGEGIFKINKIENIDKQVKVQQVTNLDKLGDIIDNKFTVDVNNGEGLTQRTIFSERVGLENNCRPNTGKYEPNTEFYQQYFNPLWGPNGAKYGLVTHDHDLSETDWIAEQNIVL